MASYLSNYLSAPRGVSTMRLPGSSSHPVIRRYSPYSGQNFRATSPTPVSAPYSTQDLASALLQQQQNRMATTPSSNFQDTYDYDPILSKIRSLGTQSVANAKTNAGALRNEAAINEGDPDLLRSLGFDENTINAAKNNPESLFASHTNEYERRYRQLADAMQAQNLYFSGEYQKNLTDLAKGFASGQGSIGQKLRELLSGVDQGVLDAEEKSRQEELAAQEQAAREASYNSLYDSLLGLGGGDGASGGLDSSGMISGPAPGTDIFNTPITADMVAAPTMPTGPTLSSYLATHPLTLPSNRRRYA